MDAPEVGAKEGDHLVTENLARVEDVQLPTRLPYHPAMKRDFGVDRQTWKALTEAIYPSAKTQEGVLLAISYCQARGLDIMKRPVHVVPIWNSQLGREVESVWPGIGELRTTAHRTGQYAGRSETAFGEDSGGEWEYTPRKGPKRTVSVVFPEWAQVTVYRLIAGEERKFVGPKVYWLETYSTIGKSDCPNSMWEKRPRGQLDKCAEAAALRAAFPEEIGDQYSSDEVGALHGAADMIPVLTAAEKPAPSSALSLRAQAEAAMASRTAEAAPELVEDEAEEPDPAPDEETPDESVVALTKAAVKELRAYADSQGVSIDEFEGGVLGEPLEKAKFAAKDPAAAESMVRKMIDDLAKS